MEDSVSGIALNSLINSEITEFELLFYLEIRGVFIRAGVKMDDFFSAMECKYGKEVCERYLRMEEICQTIYKKMAELEEICNNMEVD